MPGWDEFYQEFSRRLASHGYTVIGDCEAAMKWLKALPTANGKDLNTPLLGLFGNDDQSPTPDQVNQHEEALKLHNKDYQFHRYDGAGHGFIYYQAPLYRQQQALKG